MHYFFCRHGLVSFFQVFTVDTGSILNPYGTESCIRMTTDGCRRQGHKEIDFLQVNLNQN